MVDDSTGISSSGSGFAPSSCLKPGIWEKNWDRWKFIQRLNWTSGTFISNFQSFNLTIQTARIGVCLNHLTTKQWDETMKIESTLTWPHCHRFSLCLYQITLPFSVNAVLIVKKVYGLNFSFWYSKHCQMSIFQDSQPTRLRMLPKIITQQHEIPEYLGRSCVMGDFCEVSNPPSHLLLFA